MAGFGFVAQPLTAAVKTSPEVVFTEITATLLQQFGRNQIVCCQPHGGGIFHVTFTTTASYNKAIGEGVKIRNEVQKVTPVCGVPITVTIRNAPFAMPADVITTHLRAYGKIIHHSFECPDPAHSVSNGNRRIRMIMNQPIPNFLRIGAYQVMAVYPGVQRVCRRCAAEGHFARECTAVFCRVCRKWMSQPDCIHLRPQEQVPEDETRMLFEKERETTPERSTVDGMDLSNDPAGLWNDVFQPPIERLNDLSIQALQEMVVEMKDDSGSTWSKKSFAEVVEADLPPADLRREQPQQEDAKQRKSQRTVVDQMPKGHGQGEGQKVLLPPPISYIPTRQQGMISLGGNRAADAEQTTSCDEHLKRTLSQSSISSMSLYTACSESSEVDVSRASKPGVEKRKKKKSAKEITTN